MLYFIYDNAGKLAEVATETRSDETRRVEFRQSWNTINEAEQIASDATKLTGNLHVACDRGELTWPRFDVIAMPQVGDEVSRCFNGDCYPAGKIVRISESLRRVYTSDGTVFWRVHESDSWRANGTWFMALGCRDERNPSF